MTREDLACACLCACCCARQDGMRDIQQRADCTCKRTYYPGAEWLKVWQVVQALRDRDMNALAAELEGSWAYANECLEKHYNQSWAPSPNEGKP